MKAVAVELGALGDTEPLWRDWLEDAARRYRVDVGALDEQLPNWRPLLERFAEERAPACARRGRSQPPVVMMRPMNSFAEPWRSTGP